MQNLFISYFTIKDWINKEKENNDIVCAQKILRTEHKNFVKNRKGNTYMFLP